MYSEDNENVCFVLKFYREINKHLFKTTILDNLHVHINSGVSDYRTLIDAVRIRCAPYHHKKSLFVTIPDKPSIKSIVAREPGLKGWIGYVYSSRRSEDVRPTVAHFPDGMPLNAPPVIERSSEGSIQPNARKIEQNAKIVLWQNNVPRPAQRMPFANTNGSLLDVYPGSQTGLTLASKFVLKSFRIMWLTNLQTPEELNGTRTRTGSIQTSLQVLVLVIRSLRACRRILQL